MPPKKAVAGAGTAAAVAATVDESGVDLPNDKSSALLNVTLSLGADTVDALLRRELARVTAAQLQLQRDVAAFEEMKVVKGEGVAWRGCCGCSCKVSVATPCLFKLPS
jgi:hypothetical protein